MHIKIKKVLERNIEMEIENKNPLISDMKELLDKGFRCIYYEVDDKDNMFTVYLKNFDSEKVKVIKCNPSEEVELKEFIDYLS